MRIAVAGGTGAVGRHVVDVARERGHEVVVLTRSTGVDVTTGAGLDAALAGVEVVVDASNLPSLSAARARRFFEAATGHLLRAGAAAGVTHFLAPSVVGIDGVDRAYYAGKLAQERMLESSGGPVTIARATQFHEFAGQVLATVKGPVAVVPRVLMRPVAARELAVHLVSLAEGPPQGRAPDLVGPRDEVLVDLARKLLEADDVRRRVVEVPLPGAYGRTLASGVLRGTPPYVEGSMTFDEWLAAR